MSDDGCCLEENASPKLEKVCFCINNFSPLHFLENHSDSRVRREKIDKEDVETVLRQELNSTRAITQNAWNLRITLLK